MDVILQQVLSGGTAGLIAVLLLGLLAEAAVIRLLWKAREDCLRSRIEEKDTLIDVLQSARRELEREASR